MDGHGDRAIEAKAFMSKDPFCDYFRSAGRRFHPGQRKWRLHGLVGSPKIFSQ